VTNSVKSKTNDKKHLLIVGPDWDITTKFRKELVRDTIAAGWEVSVCAGGNIEKGKRILGALGACCYPVEFRRSGMNPLSELWPLVQVYLLCQAIKPNVVLTFTVKPNTFGQLAARLANVPVRAAMITGLGFAFISGRELRRRIAYFIVKALYRTSLASLRRVFFQNLDDKRSFEDLGLIGSHLSVSFTAGSGVDLLAFPAAPLPTTRFTFVMVARLLKEKGVFEFVEAARMVKRQYPDVRFILVGAPDQNPSSASAAQVDEWNLEGVVEAVGYQIDVSGFLRDSHVFVLPSYREGTPRSALEALAVGRPVLVADVPGCREVVVEGVTGHLVEPRSASALADGMRWFLDRREQIHDFACNARADCAKRFDVRDVNSKIIEDLANDLAEWNRCSRSKQVAKAASHSSNDSVGIP
jgi:glycosyltransferase involved in cell wall biosynthesis